MRPSWNMMVVRGGLGPKQWPDLTPPGCRQTCPRSDGCSSSMTVADFSTRDGQPTLRGLAGVPSTSLAVIASGRLPRAITPASCGGKLIIMSAYAAIIETATGQQMTFHRRNNRPGELALAWELDQDRGLSGN